MGKSSVVTTTQTTSADQRSQVDSLGAGSQFVAPEATVANPGAVAGSVGNYSQLSQNFAVTTQGMTGEQVRQMLLDQETGTAQALDAVTQVSSDAVKASSDAVNTLAAGQSGGTGDWTRYLPYIVVGVLGLMMMRRRQ